MLWYLLQLTNIVPKTQACQILTSIKKLSHSAASISFLNWKKGTPQTLRISLDFVLEITLKILPYITTIDAVLLDPYFHCVNIIKGSLHYAKNACAYTASVKQL